MEGERISCGKGELRRVGRRDWRIRRAGTRGLLAESSTVVRGGEKGGLLFPSLTLLSSGPLLGDGWDGWKNALLFDRGRVLLNQTSGRLRGLASCRVVRGLVVGDDVGLRELVAPTPAAGLDRRHARRPPTVDGFKTLDEDCSSLFEPDICPDL